jgi:hypothetical protein
LSWGITPEQYLKSLFFVPEATNQKMLHLQQSKDKWEKVCKNAGKPYDSIRCLHAIPLAPLDEVGACPHFEPQAQTAHQCSFEEFGFTRPIFALWLPRYRRAD